MVADISGGKEPVPIPAINTVDNVKLEPLEYVTQYVFHDDGVAQMVEAAA